MGAGVAAAAALALTGCGAVEVAANLTEETRTDSYERADVVELTNRDGATTIVGADVTEIEVERVLRYTGDAQPEETVTERDGVLAITAEGCGNRIVVGFSWCDINYTVTVPEGTGISVDSADGSVTVDGTGGDVTVTSADGEVTVTGRAGEVEATTRDGALALIGVEADTVTAETSDGGVRVTGGTVAEAALSSRDGGVLVEDAEFGSLDADSKDGGVEITVVAEFDAIDATARDGGVTVLVPRDTGPYAVTTSARDGAVDVSVPRSDDAESKISVTTVDGSITVAEG